MSNQGEERPLHRLCEGARLQGVGEELVQRQLPPERVEEVGAAERPSASDLQPRGCGGRGGVEVAAELIHNAADLLHVELVSTPEGVEDAGLNTALGVPLAFDELEVAGVRPALAW